jgi:PAS domain S-box-containing protein
MPTLNNRQSNPMGRRAIAKTILRILVCIVAALAVTVVLYVVSFRDRPFTAALFFLFLVLIVSAVWGLRYAIFVSFLAALAVSWLAPPLGRFEINDPRDIFALIAFLFTGTLTSYLSDRARKEALNANQSRVEAVAAERRFADLVNSVEGIVWEAEAETFAFSFVSDQAERILGYPKQRWVTEPTFWKDHLHPEDRDWAVQFCIRATSEKRSHDFEYRMIAADGRVVWVRDLVTVVVENGRATRLRGVMVDVTERKRAEDAQRRSEAYLAEAQRLTHTGSWVYKAAGGGHYWSEENFRIWEFDPKQGAPDLEMVVQRIHPKDRDRVGEHWFVRARTDFEDEFRIVLPDGAVRHIHVLGHPVFSASGELIELVGTHVDITERKRAEQERERLRQVVADLAHVNRVSMMGELTASLAHEIRQPIAAAITSADACLRWLTRNPPDLERARLAVARIKEDGTRAAEVINRLRSFYKKGAPAEPELVDVNEVAREMLVLLRSEANRYSIPMRTDLAAELPTVTADRVQLQQVFLNLMLNGIEAMKDLGGELTVKSQLDNDGQVQISVSDTGVGLPLEKVDQIFDAFFTTKRQGSGMGLAISRSIVESHGGRLWASGNTGRGATFHFTLPSDTERVKVPATRT